MGFFDDDPFEDIVKEFFGKEYNNGENEVISGEHDERTIDFIETDKKVFLIFELPGYRKEDAKVDVSGNEISIAVKRKVSESVADYLAQKLNRGVHLKKPLPKNLMKKKHSWTLKNGILEIQFTK
jgi:HSP20 family molecular chaperone IbpA